MEFALIQKDVVFGLEQGTKVLKEIHAEMGGIEHVEKLMGENAEAIAYQKVGLAQSFYPELPSLLPTRPRVSLESANRTGAMMADPSRR